MGKTIIRYLKVDNFILCFGWIFNF